MLMIRLSNYSSLLPADTLYGNVTKKITNLLTTSTPRSDSPLILETPLMQCYGIYSLVSSNVTDWCMKLCS